MLTNKSNSQVLIFKALVVLAYLAIFFFLIPWGWHVLWFSIGVLFGLGFLLGDEKFFFSWYREQVTDRFLVTRSPLFLLSLIPLTIFVMTSSGSFLASGMMGSIVLYLLLEMTELKHDSLAFDQRFLQGISGQVSTQAIQLILLGGWLFFFLVHLLMIY
ncbi:MAG: hypothetical protein A2383_00570 [Candidatus Pacebacteria bacterium RIFOXYB1_FULL_39_46]|nr:MAG: hypothetical protein A2182_00400 [Candidatus Pacebacteria bacterium RIFOXYA1_FULL_38_18]OGJ38081.1 MAG: hypothetical protein A2383_00570 [Candidatus Pacebacteria bacterium RIFOXYB1_FULL_39_46]OGJ39696.1 MAG: hypothetical protein A2411_02875 [Candidatus Pacebacteria bacterium RIFOXYC1_FULL_39_21]OGJ39833.1 MAG: hypothetical protein A2582_00335 [Candidatus Pacebacteria bacterium RIFOXYD1_FULL_39_27]